jgi:hypothetical protein
LETKKCYTWADATLSWLEANITWVEACVITKIIEEVKIKGVKPERHLKDMTKKDKQILISLITRIKTEHNNEITINSSKIKNQKVKVTIKDMEIFIKEITNIKVNVII